MNLPFEGTHRDAIRYMQSQLDLYGNILSHLLSVPPKEGEEIYSIMHEIYEAKKDLFSPAYKKGMHDGLRKVFHAQRNQRNRLADFETHKWSSVGS